MAIVLLLNNTRKETKTTTGTPNPHSADQKPQSLNSVFVTARPRHFQDNDLVAGLNNVKRISGRTTSKFSKWLPCFVRRHFTSQKPIPTRVWDIPISVVRFGMLWSEMWPFPAVYSLNEYRSDHFLNRFHRLLLLYLS